MASKQPATLLQFSAGGVVYRHDERGQIEVALISTRKGERWGLPKGWIERGEPVEEAALREVREETGLTARLLEHLDTIEYWFRVQRGGKPTRVHKQVYFFLMEANGGNLAEHDHEVDEARWYPLEEAIATITYPGERQVLIKARERLVSPS